LDRLRLPNERKPQACLPETFFSRYRLRGFPFVRPIAAARRFGRPTGEPEATRSRSSRWESRTAEIANGVYRISTFVPEIAPPADFTFNQFLVLGDEPLLFHTGLRRMFPLVLAAIRRILPPERLRWIPFGHFQADECGAMNEWLAAAPQAE
jgi:hypothetical protein